MNTTSPSTIIAKMVTVIEALTPTAAPTSRHFARSKAPNLSLRTWALEAGGNAMFRLFEIRRNGPRVEPGILYPTATLVNLELLVTVVYAAVPTLYGLEQWNELEDLIESDAHQIRDVLMSPSGLAATGHAASVAVVSEPDRANKEVWFQDLVVTAKFFASRTP